MLPLVLSTSYVPPSSSHTAKHSIFNKYFCSNFTAKKIIETIKQCLKINNAYKILRLVFKENTLNLGVFFPKSLGSVTFYVFKSSFFAN